jgi:class 3 adenylate cyclase/TolB-like protein/tetratricopeptide (TPR) repeat protein
MLADVAGYSRMMERDEAGTHLRLREVRAAVTDPAIERHHGRIVRNKGDDILVEFASAVEALSCAVEIQRAMADRNRDLTADSRIEFRIGINLGDILIDGGEIAGDGVNVAARLEALAAPGEVAISHAVREQVRQLVGVRLIDAGQHKVKNISRPIRVYKVSSDGSARRPAATWWRGRRTRRTLLWLALTLGAGTIVWHFAPWTSQHGEPPRQSLVVLPIKPRAVDFGPAAEQLTHDLTTALSQTLSGVVVAPSTAAQFRGPDIDAREAGRRLNVRYVLESTLLAGGPAMRVSAQLVSAETGAQLWSSTVDGAVPPGELVPVEVLGRLTDTVATAVRRAEAARPLPAGAAPDAYLIALRATLMLPTTDSDASLREVQQMYERALALDAHHVPALSGMAATLAVQANRAEALAAAAPLFARAEELSLRAVSTDPKDPDAWRVRATVLQFAGKLAAAAEAIDRALALNPYSNESHAQRGLILYASGRIEESVAAFDRAIRLNPAGDVVGVHLFHRCRSLLYLGRYAEAVDTCVRGTAYAPEWLDFMVLTAAYAMQGDARNAELARAELMKRRPSFHVGWLLAESAPVDPRTREARDAHLVAGLRKAGVPE